jgi:formate hydrogenlyase subunit 3/multisubunit Na+/H+ antiporter MnhD subunit
MRGQWRQALSANVGGSLLAVAAMTAATLCMISAFYGKWLIILRERTLALLAILVAVVTLVDWAIRLAMG